MTEQQRNRVTSFSVKPGDKKANEALNKLTKYSTSTGISLSYLIINAIIKYNEELKLNDNR